MAKVKPFKPSVVLPDVPNARDIETIQRRAYEKFVERGEEHGHDLEDWLSAEAELNPLSVADQPAAGNTSGGSRRSAGR